jgi:UDP-N-acetylmuramoyl-L-alanyl-D-glutamate--2,6-diaminopimelate ligase
MSDAQPTSALACELPARPLDALVAGIASVPHGIAVSDLTLDSRAVRPGGLFLAVKGRTQHGLAFASEAIARGARAVLYEAGEGVEALLPSPSAGVLVAGVARLSRHLGVLASRFFGNPGERLHIAGVTGTNGKTTSAWLLAQALTRAGRPCAYLGTLGFGMPSGLAAGEHTTPDAISVQRHLAQAQVLGAGWLAMEVSSHAIDQERIAETRFEVAAFTNLTRDHLDYHGTMEAYGATKARLFIWPGLEFAIINADDPWGRQLARGIPPASLVLTSRVPPPEGLPSRVRQVIATKVTPAPDGLILEVESTWGRARLATSLIGGFNADNLLTVLGLLLAWEIPLGEAVSALAASQAACGRMERLGGEDGRPLAVVDYAHTPDALAKALRAAREHCAGRLHVVFGCGGDRDAGKRPLMGAIAEELADELTLTDDNPRTEDPAHIVAEILEGIAHPARVHIEHDRELAIVTALTRAREGDAVLIAGKGHESYQIYGSTRRSFSDQAVVRAAMETFRK